MKKAPSLCPAWHGILLLAALTLPAVIPALAHWPWYFVGPLLCYAAIVAILPPLRRSVGWLKIGRLDAAILAVVAGIAVVSAAVLVLYDRLFHPDLHELAGQLPMDTGLPVVLAGSLFAVTNALAEEIIFRGVLQEALASQLGVRVGVFVQAAAFGLGHAKGYPPGEVGVVLAGLYGLMLGMLREWVGGLAAPVLAHIFADATIFAIVVHGV